MDVPTVKKTVLIGSSKRLKSSANIPVKFLTWKSHKKSRTVVILFLLKYLFIHYISGLFRLLCFIIMLTVMTPAQTRDVTHIPVQLCGIVWTVSGMRYNLHRLSNWRIQIYCWRNALSTTNAPSSSLCVRTMTKAQRKVTKKYWVSCTK